MTDEEEESTFLEQLKKAKTFDLSSSGTADRSEEAEWIEPKENAKTYDLDKVKKTIKVEGYDIEEPSPPEKDAEKRALEKADPTSDYKRNREDYGVICPVCKGSGKCQKCGGKGRVKLFFKCKECMGTGKCIHCDREVEIHCPQCSEPISMYADTCRSCGLLMLCPECGAHLPAMATRCISCRTEFKCKICGKPYPRHYSWRCPHCGHWNE